MLRKAEFSWLSFFYTYRQITEPKHFTQVNWQRFQVLICSETLYVYFCGRSAFLIVVLAFKKHADHSSPTEDFKMPVGSQPNRTAWTFKWMILIANALLALLLWVFFWTGCIIQLQLRQCFINSLFQVHWADIPTGFFLSASICLALHIFSSQLEIFSAEVHVLLSHISLLWLFSLLVGL